MIRHFDATVVLSETVRKATSQLLSIFVLLIFLVIVFAIMLFEIESGKACFVGDPGCVPPDSIQDIVHDGDRIIVNKLGGVSQFPDVFYGLWFCFVTLTSTGYE